MTNKQTVSRRSRSPFVFLLFFGLASLAPISAQDAKPQSDPSDGSKIVSPALPVGIVQPQNPTPQAEPDKKDRKDRKRSQAAGDASPDQAGKTEALVVIEADEQRKDGDIYTADGFVDITYQGSRLQADHVVYNEKTGDAVAEGNVVYDPAPGQHLTSRKGEINIRTKRGTFTDVTGYTDQTRDGTLLEFTADRVDKTGTDTYLLYNASVTSCCEDAVPLWQISAGKTDLKVNKRVTARNGLFKIRGKSVFYLPVVSLPINRRNRQSGFLIPSFGSGNNTGRIFRNSYYQTLGESADILFRGDFYTERGVGIGATLRARTGPDSFIKIGSYTVIDRIFGPKASDATPNQGGTLFFAQGVQYFPHGFLGVVDVNFTTDLDFRSIFANDIEEAFNPEKRSQVYLNNNFRNFSFNFLAESRTTRINVPTADGGTTSVDVNVRNSPTFNFTVNPMPLNGWPVYVSGEANISGMRREEIANTGTTFQTPTIVQRLDIAPKVTLPFATFAGWAITPSLGVRSTYYSTSFDALSYSTPTPFLGPAAAGAFQTQPPRPGNGVNGRSVFRNFIDFTLDIRPPALERIYTKDDGSPRFKHMIETYLTYRRVKGIDEFGRTLRFDLLDTFADTNEFEYALVNRFFTPRRVSGKRASKDGKDEKQIQAREIFSIAVTQKYFFDPTFGGALVAGQRNQIAPILSLSGFNYGGLPRRFSPLNVKARYSPLSSMFADIRFDYDTRENLVRGFGAAAGITRPKFRIQQRWYYSNRIQLKPGLFEAGTFTGNQLISNASVGSDEHGWYGGFNISYDFSKSLDQTTNQLRRNGLIRTGAFLGYAFKCASLELDYRSVNLGVATTGRLTFSFTLRGIGTFGTDQLGGFDNR